ncbi:MAG: hypothetical protein AAGB29_03225 [Planctomycetota bacterium]
MATPTPENDLTRDPAVDDDLDAGLDELLDQTLGRDETPPYLADRIVEATLPELRRATPAGPVLARIGPALKIGLRVAAVVAIGAVVTLALINAPSNESVDTIADGGEQVAPVPEIDEPQGPSLAEALAPLDRLDAALAETTPRQEALDAELDLLAMRVELASVDRSWNDAESLLDASLTAMELEQADGLSSLTF